ncbi:MAG TPA: hypothetical protein VI756_12620 [Blastocatellia bacterium]
MSDDGLVGRLPWRRRIDWRRLVLVAAPVAIVFLINHYLQMRSAVFLQLGGASGLLAKSSNPPIMVVLNAFYLFSSANKGLFMYNLLLLAAFTALPIAWKKDKGIVTFALLALGGIVAGISLTIWSDEIWGPRYLHSAVAPLMICLALSRQRISFTWRRLVPIGLCTTAGLVISFLGVFFWSHLLHLAAVRSQRITVEQLQHAPEWNPIDSTLSFYGYGLKTMC